MWDREKGRIASKVWRENNTDRGLEERKKRYYAKYPKKLKAKNIINNLLLRKKLFKEPCEICGATNGIEGHHTDYSKPLEVVWLCRKHHNLIHGIEKQLLEGVSTPPCEETYGSTNNVNNTLRAS